MERASRTIYLAATRNQRPEDVRDENPRPSAEYQAGAAPIDEMADLLIGIRERITHNTTAVGARIMIDAALNDLYERLGDDYQ